MDRRLRKGLHEVGRGKKIGVRTMWEKRSGTDFWIMFGKKIGYSPGEGRRKGGIMGWV